MTAARRPHRARSVTPLQHHHAPRRTVHDPANPVKVVALGGGHGLAANLRALRLLADEVTAVVTVADNGGSSGRIREQMPVLPPGDLRMAIAALCEDSEWGDIWEDIIQHRFTAEGELNGHSLGNLLLVGMWQLHDDPVVGLDRIGRLLGIRGRVLPMALDPVDIEADVTDRDGTTTVVRGQWQIATAAGKVQRIRLQPEQPRVPEDVITAIMNADWVIVGPGSWYTSVLPHLHVPDLAAALRDTPARRCVTMNLSAGAQETEGMSSQDLLAELFATAPGMRFDALIADPTALDDAYELTRQARAQGIRALLRQVSVGPGIPIHDPVRLAAAYRDVMDGVYGDLADRDTVSREENPGKDVNL